MQAQEIERLNTALKMKDAQIEELQNQNSQMHNHQERVKRSKMNTDEDLNSTRNELS